MDLNVRAQHLPYFSGLFHVRYLDKNGIFTWMRCFIEILDGFIRFWKNQNNFDQKLQSFSVIDIYNICSQDIQKLNCDQQFYRRNSIVFYTYERNFENINVNPFIDAPLASITVCSKVLSSDGVVTFGRPRIGACSIEPEVS